MMGDKRRTEEPTMCSCFSLLLQSRMFCERTFQRSLHHGQQSEPVIPLQVQYILSVVIVIFVDSVVQIF